MSGIVLRTAAGFFLHNFIYSHFYTKKAYMKKLHLLALVAIISASSFLIVANTSSQKNCSIVRPSYSIEKIISDLRTMVEEACNKKSNVYGPHMWTHHVTEVARHAKELAPKLGADIEVVEIAALLHDFAAITDVKYEKEHHIHGAKMANEILSKMNFPRKKIEMVKQAIFSHRASRLIEQHSPEEKCVASADAMAHINQLPEMLHYVYAVRKMEVEPGRLWLKAKLERDWKKLCPEAKALIKEKYACVMNILEDNRNE
jgi:putative nucleotidyltransferase with HDIG domain